MERSVKFQWKEMMILSMCLMTIVSGNKTNLTDLQTDQPYSSSNSCSCIEGQLEKQTLKLTELFNNKLTSLEEQIKALADALAAVQDSAPPQKSTASKDGTAPKDSTDSEDSTSLKDSTAPKDSISQKDSIDPKYSIAPKDGNDPKDSFAPKVCPNGWAQLTKTGACYKMFNEFKTWDDAETDCQLRGGHLVSINSDEEWTFLKGGFLGFWAEGIQEEGLWTWSDGSSWDWNTKWADGQPSGESGDKCLVMSPYDDGQMFDIDCTTAYFYTCEI